LKIGDIPQYTRKYIKTTNIFKKVAQVSNDVCKVIRVQIITNLGSKARI